MVKEGMKWTRFKIGKSFVVFDISDTTPYCVGVCNTAKTAQKLVELMKLKNETKGLKKDYFVRVVRSYELEN